jgi:hypothetical protein
MNSIKIESEKEYNDAMCHPDLEYVEQIFDNGNTDYGIIYKIVDRTITPILEKGIKTFEKDGKE